MFLKKTTTLFFGAAIFFGFFISASFPAGASHVDGRTDRGHFGAAEGARLLENDGNAVRLPGSQRTDVAVDGDVVTLGQGLVYFGDLSGSAGQTTNISGQIGKTILAHEMIKASDGTLWLAFIYSHNGARRLGASRWVPAENAWRAAFPQEPGQRYDGYPLEAAGQELDDIRKIELRENGFGHINIFFEEGTLGDIYQVRLVAEEEPRRPTNISNNPSLSADFSVNATGDVVVWVDNATHAALGGDVYLSRYYRTGSGEWRFSDPVNATGALPDRATLMFSSPHLAGNASRLTRLYAFASPGGRDPTTLVSIRITGTADSPRFEALQRHTDHNRQGTTLKVVRGGKLGPRSYDDLLDTYLIIVEDSHGAMLFNNFDDLGRLGEGIRLDGAKDVYSSFQDARNNDTNGLGTLLYRKDQTLYFAHMVLNRDRGIPRIVEAPHPALDTGLDQLRVLGLATRPNSGGEGVGIFSYRARNGATRLGRVTLDESIITVNLFSSTASDVRLVPESHSRTWMVWKEEVSRVRGAQIESLVDRSTTFRGGYAPEGQFTSGKINQGNEQVRRVEFISTHGVDAVGGARQISYSVSNDGGVTWRSPQSTNFTGNHIPLTAGHYYLDFSENSGNDLRIRAALSTNDQLQTPSISYLRVAYYTIQENRPPTIEVLSAEQLLGTRWVLVRYRVADPDGARGRLTTYQYQSPGFQGDAAGWHPMAFVAGHTNPLDNLAAGPQGSTYQFMWDASARNQDGAGSILDGRINLRFKVSDGALESDYGRITVPVDVRAPRWNHNSLNAAAPQTQPPRINVAISRPQETNLSHYTVSHLELPYTGNEVTVACGDDIVGNEGKRAASIVAARRRSGTRVVRDARDYVIQNLRPGTCYAVFLEAHDTFGNIGLLGPATTTTPALPAPAVPAIRLVGVPRQAGELISFDYRVTDLDSTRFSLFQVVRFTDQNGNTRSVTMSDAGAGGSDGELITFFGGETSQQFRFVWRPRDDMGRYAISDNQRMTFTFRVQDDQNQFSGAMTVDGIFDVLAPRVGAVSIDSITSDTARAQWEATQEANFRMHELWVAPTEGAARFRLENQGAVRYVAGAVGAREYTLNNLQPDRQYYVCLFAYDLSGNFNWPPSCAQNGFRTQPVRVNRQPYIETRFHTRVNEVTDKVKFQLFVKDPDGDRVKVIAHYSTDGRQTTRPATGIDPTRLYEEFAVHSFEWRYQEDMPAYSGDADLIFWLEDEHGLRSGARFLTAAGLVPADSDPPTWLGDIRVSDITQSGAKLSWNAGEDQNGPVFYEVRIVPAGAAAVSFPTVETTIEPNFFASGTDHAVEVKAVDGFGNTTAPKSARFTTLPAQIPIINPSIVIDNNAAETTDNSVDLTLSAGGADEMWVSNAADFSSGNWRALEPILAWELPIAGGAGVRTVHAKFRNASGAVSGAVSDSIRYAPDDGDANIEVNPGQNINVTAIHEPDPFIAPSDRVVFVVEHQGNPQFDRIELRVDGQLQGVCASGDSFPCRLTRGPFAADREHTYFALLVPVGANVETCVRCIRSQDGSFRVESQDPTLTISIDPQNPYAGRQVTIRSSFTPNIPNVKIETNIVDAANRTVAAVNCRAASCSGVRQFAAGDYSIQSYALTLDGDQIITQATLPLTVRVVQNPDPPTVDVVINPAQPKQDQVVHVIGTTQGQVNYRNLILMVDGNEARRCPATPCEYDIPAHTLAIGRHTLEGRTDGNPLATKSIAFDVAAADPPPPPEAPPTLELVTAPGAPTAGDPITLTATTQGSFDRIDLLVNDAVIHTCNGSPCSHQLALAQGEYTAKARATYTRQGVSAAVAVSRVFSVAASPAPPEEENDIVQDRAPETIALAVEPRNVITEGEVVTLVGTVTGQGVRMNRIEIYEGPLGGEQLARTCQAATTCRFSANAAVVGVHGAYLKVYYHVGNAVREAVGRQVLYLVETREQAREQELTPEEFDEEHHTEEAGADAIADEVLTNDGAVRVQANGLNLCFMRFALDPLFGGAEWLPYAASYEYRLPQSEGAYTLYIQYKSCAGDLSPVYTRELTFARAVTAVANNAQAAYRQAGQAGTPGAGVAGSESAATSPDVIKTFSFLCSDTKIKREAAFLRRFFGRIMLAVERKGEAFYLFKKDSDPDTKICGYYLGRPTHAFSVMQFLGVGAPNSFFTANFQNFRTPGPGDRAVFTVTPVQAKRLDGKILLQVETNGEAYYINGGKAYYLGRPADAFRIMRELGLGINNTNLKKVPLYAEILKGRL